MEHKQINYAVRLQLVREETAILANCSEDIGDSHEVPVGVLM